MDWSSQSTTGKRGVRRPGLSGHSTRPLRARRRARASRAVPRERRRGLRDGRQPARRRRHGGALGV